ncbi:MAG: NADH:flavin oxidoreductase [Desulfomonile sp.]|jgi:2,4-dienoyl-CoA reductase-like NADH-dependent reductase (Old Yellow Enzyme family)
MPELFEKTAIKSLELDNRSVRSATWSGVGDPKGYVTDRALEFYGHLAAGGVGLIVTGFQYVMPNAVAMPHQIGNYSDDLLEGLSRLAEAIHSRGGKVIAQLVHTGGKANPKLFLEEGEIWGPSAVPDPLTGNIPKEMTRQDITQAIEAYATAALRAQRAGFDGVQLHGAHGYGINHFLSGAMNRRSDGYGGDIGRRYRFLGEVNEAVRGAVGKDYPLFIKLSGNDYFPGGLVPEESLYIARRLVEDGIDCIEVSAGSRASANGMVPSRTKIRREENEAYLAELAGRFKEAVNVPIITVGGIRSFAVVSRILADGLADYVAFSRPLIREPHLINRWKSGDLGKAKCISCNGCFDTGLEGFGVICKVERKLREEQQDPGH